MRGRSGAIESETTIFILSQCTDFSPGNSSGAAAPGVSCSVASVSSSWKDVMQPVVFEEVHLVISSSLEPTFEAVQRRSINVLLC